MKKNKKTIVLTGGHAGTTALAVVEEIEKQKLNWKIHWIGVKKSIEGKNVLSLEYSYLNKKDVFFHPIITGRLQQKFSVWTIPSFFKIPLGFIQSAFLLVRIKPSVVLSFGGYASFPVVILSKILGIPIIIHEQTATTGRSNRAVAKLANKILLSRETSKNYFPKGKCLVVGNPILSHYFDYYEKLSSNLKTILVLGGSRGSQYINGLIAHLLDKILEKYKLIHLTGELDYKKFLKLKENLEGKKKANYQVISTVDPYEMINIYKKADVVVSRAGANTVSELMAMTKPAVFIPIPWSYNNEQYKNAEYAKNHISLVILNQNLLDGNKLLESIDFLINKKLFLKKYKSVDKEASEKIVNILSKYIK